MVYPFPLVFPASEVPAPEEASCARVVSAGKPPPGAKSSWHERNFYVRLMKACMRPAALREGSGRGTGETTPTAGAGTGSVGVEPRGMVAGPFGSASWRGTVGGW